MPRLRIINFNVSFVDLLKCIAGLTLLVYLCSPHRFAVHYDYIPREAIYDALVPGVTPNVTQQDMPECSNYRELIADRQYTYVPRYTEHILHGEEIQLGGEYTPVNCKPRFSTAIIVPYRQREEQLHAFLSYMHNYLRQQALHYRIYLIEQYDQKPFNRAKLFNIGARIAAEEHDFPCLVLHDVDLLPLNSGHLYACSERPRHMCAALDIWRFHLPYHGLFGGVVAITAAQYHHVNGMSNMYEGWGGEDDDLYARLGAYNLDICRFPPAYNEYTMLRHKPAEKNEKRGDLLRAALQRATSDGLNSLVYKEHERRLHSLFTHILVET